MLSLFINVIFEFFKGIVKGIGPKIYEVGKSVGQWLVNKKNQKYSLSVLVLIVVVVIGILTFNGDGNTESPTTTLSERQAVNTIVSIHNTETASAIPTRDVTAAIVISAEATLNTWTPSHIPSLTYTPTITATIPTATLTPTSTPTVTPTTLPSPRMVGLHLRSGGSEVVYVSQGFWVDKREVTYEQFQLFLDGRPDPYSETPPFSVTQRPRMFVTAAEAKAYCEWAGGRLLTYDEWLQLREYQFTQSGVSVFNNRPWLEQDNTIGLPNKACDKITYAYGNTCNNDYGPSDVIKNYSKDCVGDLFGNAMEWVSRTSGYQAVDGSWLTDFDSLIDFSGNIRNPNERYNDVGFRCMYPNENGALLEQLDQLIIQRVDTNACTP